MQEPYVGGAQSAGSLDVLVSRLRLENHPDQPEWLSHVNANVLKVKLATAIIGISSIHLLKSFISAGTLSDKTLLWQTAIHGMFLVSAVAIALIDRLMAGTLAANHRNGANGHAAHAGHAGHSGVSGDAGHTALASLDRLRNPEGIAQG